MWGRERLGKKLANVEPATALTLARYFLRGLDCGAIESSEIEKLTKLDEAGLRDIVLKKGVI